MSKEMLVIVLGLLVVVIPNLGIYRSWQEMLLLAVGVTVTVVGFLLRGEVIARGAGSSEKNAFVERGGG